MQSQIAQDVPNTFRILFYLFMCYITVLFKLWKSLWGGHDSFDIVNMWLG